MQAISTLYLKNIKKSHKLDQIVKRPTRNESILDKIFTNVKPFYDDPKIMPHLGKSDHMGVLLKPVLQPNNDKGKTQTLLKTKIGQNERSFFALELQKINWQPLYKLNSVTEQLAFFNCNIQHLIQKYFPLKKVSIHTNDKPWITYNFKCLIKRRQSAFYQGNTALYNMLRNKINRQNKLLRRNFYNRKVKQLRESNQKGWWKNIKELMGTSNKSQLATFQNLTANTTKGNLENLTHDINCFFKSISDDLTPLEEGNRYSIMNVTIPKEYTIDVSEVELNLSKIDINKAAGPDGIHAWILRDFAPFLAKPVTSIFNSSIRDGIVPTVWKHATISPIPKVKQPKNIKTDLRPISLTPILAKELERFVIKWTKELCADTINKDQYGNMKNCSTTHMLIEILHKWYETADNNNNCTC